MGKFFQDLDAGMRRAVQQESRSLSSGLSNNKRKKKPQGRCCLLLVMVSPMVLFFMLMYVMNMYNAMVQYDEQQQKLLLLQAQHENEHQREKGNNNDEQKVQEQQLLRKRQADVARLAARSDEETSTLVLTTSLGPIRIQMRPDLSEGSVDYIRRLIESQVCRRCNFYRAEKPGILQGVMANRDVPINTERGTCPPDAASVKNDCPKWDPECGCHGPLMTRGSVAWAAGQAGGPDFFIDAYKRPANWWGTQHTNFGFIQDPASMAIVDQIFGFPVKESGGMHHLKDAIQFTMTLE
jgi:cyclophilin family peptidyl-prolyl cis-trans isomerase